MSYANTRTLLENLLKLGWTTTPIKFQDVRFDPPMNNSGNPLPYIAFILRGGSSEDLVLGSPSRWYRYTGVVIVQIFTPELTGLGLATQYADSIKAIYLQGTREHTYLSSGIVRLYPPYATEIGTVGGYHQTNVTVPFKRDAQT